MNVSGVTTLLKDLHGIGRALTCNSILRLKSSKATQLLIGSQSGASDAFDRMFRRLRDSILIVSYSSSSYPTRGEIISFMLKYKQHIEVIDIDYRYSFGTQSQNNTQYRNIRLWSSNDFMASW